MENIKVENQRGMIEGALSEITRTDERRADCIRLLEGMTDEKALERIYWTIEHCKVKGARA